MDKIKITPKMQNENNREFAYRVLRENILTMSLCPGDILNEAQLSDLFSVSRTPVREALLKLREEQLVDIYPQRSSQVSLIDLPLMQEGVLMRSLVEPRIYRQLFGNLDLEITELFKSNLRRQERAVADQDTHSFFTFDGEFHDIIYQAARKPNIGKACQTITSQFERIRYLVTIEKYMNIATVYEQHVELYIRLLTGSGQDNRQYYREHLTGYEVYLDKMVESYPAYFKRGQIEDEA